MIPEHKKLNIGCGFKKLDDFWNVDVEERCRPDEVVDLETLPWSWPDDFFEKINASNVLGQLGQDAKTFTGIIKEMYRVSQDKAEWHISLPHHRSDIFWDDYMQIRSLTPRTFSMFDQSRNVNVVTKGIDECVYGILNDVDIEIYDVNYQMLNYWRKQQSDGMLGNQQLEINLNTLWNVAETVSIFLRVHKPGRYSGYLTRTN